ncbi:hypothetical protein LINPERPRIM_LOCUS18496 [Linum perenne]
MALRLMKLGNTLIKQVTSPPSTRLSTRMERRFSNQASHVPIKDQEKEAACGLPIWVYGVFGGGLLSLGKIHAESSRELETYRKESLEKLAVGFSAGGYISSSYLLWKVNKKQLLEVVLDEMFHAALNLNLHAAHEIDLNKEVLNLPPEKREGPDKVKFDKLRNARLLIHSSLMKIDDAIMLFHDF